MIRLNRFLIFLALFGSLFFLFRKESDYPSLQDPYHPTLKDCIAMQSYLQKKERPYIQLLQDFQGRSRIRLVGKGVEGRPERGIISVNGEKGVKENCLILYATWNKNYRAGLKRLLDHVSASDFKGDILYRVGGWPNCEMGDFALAHVPYAFKPCMFREAKRLGYKRTLWLDSSIVPLVSLNTLFETIEKQGYLVMGNQFMVGPFFNETAAEFYHISLKETMKIPSCSSGIVGLDFTNAKAAEALTLWHRAAQDPAAFFSARPDQNALSLILYQLGMKEWLDLATLAHGKEKMDERSLFLLERGFVQDY